jgi:hypothetical protein
MHPWLNYVPIHTDTWHVSSKIELGIWRVAVSSLETPTAIPVFCVFFSPFESAHTPNTLQRGISPFRCLFTQFDWSSRVWFDHQRSHLIKFFVYHLLKNRIAILFMQVVSHEHLKENRTFCLVWFVFALRGSRSPCAHCHLVCDLSCCSQLHAPE